MEAIAMKGSREGMLYLKQNNALQAGDLFNSNKQAFGLTQNDNVILIKSEQISPSLKIHVYQHRYLNLPVEKSYINVLEIDGSLYKVNYTFDYSSLSNVTPSIIESIALNNATSYIGAFLYSWQDSLHLDSVPPAGELLVYDNILSYKFKIQCSSPVEKQTIFVDAISGNILNSYSDRQYCSTHNTSLPICTSNQDITLNAGGYLYDDCNDDIHAYLYQPDAAYANGVCNEVPTPIIEIYVDPNSNDPSINPYLDQYFSGYWSSKITKEYWNLFHNGYNSYNGTGAPMDIVYKSNPCTSLSQCAVGPFHSNNKIYFDENGAYSDIEIVGHEWTHALINNAPTPLQYQDESGALNESFADIFGFLIENYAFINYDLINSSYVLGENTHLVPGACSYIFEIRDMSNPNGVPFYDPQNYQGVYWINYANPPTIANDFNGVHTNSGVQNYWFYLLTNNPGGTSSSTNEFGYAYNVGSLDLATVGNIAFQNIRTLPANASYLDAAENSVIIAFNEYGICSYEMSNVVTAWKAVNVFPPSSPALSVIVSITDVACFGEENGTLSVNVSGGLAPYFYSLDNVNYQLGNSFSGLAAGNYTLFVKDANCTMISENVVILEPTQALLTTLVNQTDVSIQLGNDGEFEVSTTGGVSGFEYSLDNGSTWTANSVFNNLSAGTYQVITRDANNCQTENFIQINEPNSLLITVSNNNSPICYGSSNGEIIIAVAGGSGSYSYLWNNQQTNATAINLAAGTYYVSVTDNNTGALVNAQATITPNPEILFSTNIINETGQNADGSIEVVVLSGGQSPFQYAINGGTPTSNPLFTNLSTGNFQIDAIDAQSCMSSGNFTLALEFTASIINNNCGNSNAGEIVLVPQNGVPPYTYSWNNNATTSTLSNLINGVYSVNITDNAGNTFNETYTITSTNTPIIASFNITPESCLGNDGAIEVVINSGGTPPFSFSLNGGPFQSLNTFDFLTSDNYTIVIKDDLNCEANTSVNLTSSSPYSISYIAINEVICKDDGSVEVLIGGSPALPLVYEFGLVGNSPFQVGNTNTSLGLGPENYFVTTRDANGCTQTEYFTINGPNFGVFANAVNNCGPSPSGNIDLTVVGGTAPYTFVWSNGASTEDLSNLSAGTYSVTVEDANGCITGGVYPLNDFNVSWIKSDITCNGLTDGMIDLTVTGGTPPYTYEWNIAGSSNIFSNAEDLSSLSANSYMVLIQDAIGCARFIDGIVINEPPILGLSVAVQSNPLCSSSNDGVIQATATGGTPPYQYSLNGINYQNSNSLTTAVVGNNTAYVRDANGCVQTENVTLTPSITLPSGANQISIANLPVGITNYSSPKFIVNDLIIPNDAILNITSTTIYLNAGVKLIVEPGGTLNITNSTLTAACPYNFWGGILTTDLPNSPTNEVPIVSISSNTILEYANIGVATEHLDVFKSFPPKDDLPDLNIQNSTFKDCFIGIQIGKSTHGFISFDDWHSNSSNIFISGNTFECNASLPDPAYGGKGTKTFIEKYGYSLDVIANNFFTNHVNLGVNQKPNGVIAFGGYANYFNFAEIKGNTFTNLSKGLVLNNLGVVGGDAAIASNKNTFNNVEKGIYISGQGDILGNDFNNIPSASDDNNWFTIDDTYGVFVVGENSRDVIGNNFYGDATSNSNNPNLAASYGIVFEQTGSGNVTFFDNHMKDTDVGIQVEGQNNHLKIRCNHFAESGVPHNVAAWVLTENTNSTIFGGSSTPGQLRFQGDGCLAEDLPQGNEWHDVSGTAHLKDFVFGPNSLFFEHYTHTQVENNNTTRTYPANMNLNVYNSWTAVNNPNGLEVCGLGTNGYEKTGASCINSGLGKAPSGTNGSNGLSSSIVEILANKTLLNIQLVNLESQLIDPPNQKSLILEIKNLQTQIEEHITKLSSLYREVGLNTEAILLLENEDYTEAKKELAEIYRLDSNFVKSREAHDELESIATSRPLYMFETMDDQQRYELNNIYFKEINELLIQAKEDNRNEDELVQWEIYALELIAQSGLPVAIDAEKILELNQVNIPPHQIEKVSTYWINNPQILISNFDYALSLSPNPAMYNTTVSVNVPENIGTAQLLLVDTYNNLGTLGYIPLNIGSNAVSFDVVNYFSGVYTIILEVDGINVANKHLVIIH
jgi:Zn-dependent metalloprotease